MGTACTKGVDGAVFDSHTGAPVQYYYNTTIINSESNSNNCSCGNFICAQGKNTLYRGTPQGAHVHSKAFETVLPDQEDGLSLPSVCDAPATPKEKSSPSLLSFSEEQRPKRQRGKKILSPSLRRQSNVKSGKEIVAATPGMIYENDMTTTFNRREWMARRHSGNVDTGNMNDCTTLPMTTPAKQPKVRLNREPSTDILEMRNEDNSSIVVDTYPSSSTATTEDFPEFSASVSFVERANPFPLSSPRPYGPYSSPPVAAETTDDCHTGSLQHVFPLVSTGGEGKNGRSTFHICLKPQGCESEIASGPSARKTVVTSHLLSPNVVLSPSEVEDVVETRNGKQEEEQAEERGEEGIRLPYLTAETKCSGRGDTPADTPTGVNAVRPFTVGDSSVGSIDSSNGFLQLTSLDTLSSVEEASSTLETMPTTPRLTSTEERPQRKGVGNIFPTGSPLIAEVENEEGAGKGLSGFSHAVHENHISEEETEGGEIKKQKEESDVNGVSNSNLMKEKNNDKSKKMVISPASPREAIEGREEGPAGRGGKIKEIDIWKTSNTPKGTENLQHRSRSSQWSVSCEGPLLSPHAVRTSSSFICTFSHQPSANESTRTSPNMNISSVYSCFGHRRRDPASHSNRLLSPSPLVSPQPSEVTRTPIRAPTRVTVVAEEGEDNKRNYPVQSNKSTPPLPYRPMNVTSSHHRYICSPATETFFETTTDTTGGGLGPTPGAMTARTSSRNSALSKRGAECICQWCGSLYELDDICRVKREPHVNIRQQRKHEKQVKTYARSLLRSGRVREAFRELQGAGLM